MSYLKEPTIASSWENSLDFLWLEITSKCNLNCLHCYADSTPQKLLRGKMSLADWRQVILDSSNIGCKKIQFTGGEPTIHPELLDLIAIARDAGYELIEVYTNGTGLTDRILSAFEEYGVNLALSFYSYNYKTHDSITLQSGSYSKTVIGILKAISKGIKVRVGIVEMPENVDHINDTFNFIKMLGVQEIRIDKKRAIGRAEERIDIDSKTSQLCGACWQGKLAVVADGNVYPCVFSRFYKVGHVSEGIRQILLSHKLRSFRSNIHHVQTTMG